MSFLRQSLKFIVQTLSKLKLLISSIQSCLRICSLEYIPTFYCKTVHVAFYILPRSRSRFENHIILDGENISWLNSCAL